MSAELTEYAIIINLKIENNKHGLGYLIPIKRIDGVDVLARIQISCTCNGRSYYMFTIESPIVCDGESGCPLQLFYLSRTEDQSRTKVQEMCSFLETIQQTLPKLKFDKMTSEFTTEPITQIPRLCDALFKFDNIEMDYQECCICHDITERVTRCQHCLCIPCHHKIKTQKDENDNDVIRCPICREDL